MWVVKNKETKEVVFEGETYKQCLNYLNDKKNRGEDTDKYRVAVDK